MIEFPETATAEWTVVAERAGAEDRLRARLARDTQVEVQLEKLRVAHEAKTKFEAELAAEATPELEMTTLADYKANPAAAGPGDLIEGVMKDDGMCLMLGPSGSGKSTLALQAVYSLATGTDFLGQTATKLSGGIGVVSYDMAGSLMLDWMAGFPNLDPTRVHLVNAYKQGNPLAVPEHGKVIADVWKANDVEVVLIDSFSASFFGRDQNDAAEAQKHYRDLKQFALNECGARAVIIIVHSTEGSPKKPRGTTVHQDVADSIVSIWQPNKAKGDPARHVDLTKYRQHRDAASGQMTRQMDPVVISEPDPATHLVDLDTGAMVLAGMEPPAGTAGSIMFPELPEPENEPDTDSESDLEGDDDL